METMIAIAHFLRQTPCKHVLLLVNPKIKARMLEDWESADGRRLSKQFSLTSMPQNAQDAQVCIASVFDIQVQIGVDSTQPFFKMFDAVVLCDDVSTNRGPAWHQIVELFTIMDTRVLELCSLLSEERV
jgi:hypothetical protein